MSPRITMLRASLAGVLTASALAVPSLHAQWGGVAIDPVVLNGPPGHARCMTGSAPYATFSQQEWGRAHGLAANVRDQWFSRALPHGLVVGDGACGPRHPAYGLLFTNGLLRTMNPVKCIPCCLIRKSRDKPGLQNIRMVAGPLSLRSFEDAADLFRPEPVMHLCF